MDAFVTQIVLFNILLTMVTSEILQSGIIPPGYISDLAPTQPDGSPLIVKVSMTMNAVSEIDIKKQTILFEMYFRIIWTDDRLHYPQSETNETLEFIELSSGILSKLWVPDPYIPDAREVEKLTLVKDFDGLWFYPDKSFFFSRMLKVRSSCPMTFYYFPFDEQTCYLNVSSYLYTTMKWAWSGVGLRVAKRMDKYLANYHFKFSMLPTNSCYCDECSSDYFPCVGTTLWLRRRYMVHILSAYVPSALFVAVAWMSLVWPADVIPGRTVLVITSLLTQCSVYFNVGLKSPETSYIKAVDVWMFCCILLSVGVLFEYGVILKLKQLEDKAREKEKSTVKVLPKKDAQLNKQKGAPEYYKNMQKNVERTSFVAIPLFFFIFNIIYWSIYT